MPCWKFHPSELQADKLKDQEPEVGLGEVKARCRVPPIFGAYFAPKKGIREANRTYT
jgi:hypothetical protein